MNRDQIKEMAHDMCEYYYDGTCYQDKKPCDCKCEIFTDAQYLYAKGYRKSVDVARAIFSDIEAFIGAVYNKWIFEKRLYDDEKEIVMDFCSDLDFADLKKKYESEGADDETKADT